MSYSKNLLKQLDEQFNLKNFINRAADAANSAEGRAALDAAAQAARDVAAGADTDAIVNRGLSVLGSDIGQEYLDRGQTAIDSDAGRLLLDRGTQIANSPFAADVARNTAREGMRLSRAMPGGSGFTKHTPDQFMSRRLGTDQASQTLSRGLNALRNINRMDLVNY